MTRIADRIRGRGGPDDTTAVATEAPRRSRVAALPVATPREFLAALSLEVAGEAPGFLHPVNWMGRTIWLLERLAPRSGKARQMAYGAGMAAIVPAAFTALAWRSQRRAYERGPTQGLATSAALLKSTFAVRALGRAAGDVRSPLEAGDIEGAREALRSLVARGTDDLSAGLIASAAIESVAENTTDSFIAPWLYYTIGGLPAAFFYRAVNTLDSRVGYTDPHHKHIGWASAKLDDVLNFVPSRAAAILIAASAVVWRQDARGALATRRRDAKKTASPNAGQTMAAMSGALRVRLAKPGHYSIGRRWWGQPNPKQIGRSVWMMYTVAAMAAAVVYGLLTLRERILTAPADELDSGGR